MGALTTLGVAVATATLVGPVAGATAPTAPADIEPGESVVASLTRTGEPAHRSAVPALDRDGSVVAFWSTNTRMLDGERIPEGSRLFARDLEAEQIVLVNRLANGKIPRKGRVQAAQAVSADGRYVAFSSNLAGYTEDEDVNKTYDVFLRDTVLGTTTLVSRNMDGAAAGGTSTVMTGGVSADGRFVVFHSYNKRLVPKDTNDTWDVFVFDALDKSVTAVSGPSDKQTANGSSAHGTISADGRYVAFASSAADLVKRDRNGVSDIFVRDLRTGAVRLVSQATDGTQANDSSRIAGISADGQAVAFTSLATNLTADQDTQETRDIFYRDIATGTTTLVTRNLVGAAAGGIDYDGEPSISDDGTIVVYDSVAADVVPGDTNDSRDVFAYNAVKESTVLVSRNQGGGFANGASSWPAISGDGQLVGFSSDATDIVPGASGVVFLHRLLWN